MRRNLLFVLLLAVGVVLAEAQVKTEAHQKETKESQAQTEAAEGLTEEAQAQADAAEGETEEAQLQTDAAEGETEEAQLQTDAAEGETEDAQEQTQKDPKVISGMSILGNQEAPKSLVIVPWKSSEIGNSMDISTILDDSRQPVDREVFMRALRYYEIRSETQP
jgi:hypothetical protein